jgi:hypothetical protein
MTVIEAVDRLPRRVAGWAAAQTLPPNSMTGISLALGVCAAVWFTAGTRPGNAAGALALCGSYLASRAARRLAAAPPARPQVGAGPDAGGESADRAPSLVSDRAIQHPPAGPVSPPAGPVSPPAGPVSPPAAPPQAGAGPDAGGESTNRAPFLVSARAIQHPPAGSLPPPAGALPGRGRAGRAGGLPASELAARAKALSDGRLARAGAAATECGVYAGLAAGGPVVGGLFARSMQTAGPMPGWSGSWQLAMTVVIVVAVSQLAVACGSPAPPGMPWEAARGEAARGEAARGEAARGEAAQGKAAPGGLGWQVLGMPYGGRILLIAVVAPVLGARGTFLGLLGWAVIAIGYAIVSSQRRRGGARAARAIVACRDDGLIATEIGLPVRGQLVPLPPALTGVAAVAVLAILGLRNLPGFLLLAPVVAMLLAAVGSSNPHVGRLDWVVPVLLQAGQFGYIAAIGVATGVPATLIFVASALTALHYVHLAGHPVSDSAVGWEGRMIAAGLGAALGMATFAYLLLAAYLGVLICREFMTSWLPATEGDRR